jgi:hypothetical protein
MAWQVQKEKTTAASQESLTLGLDQAPEGRIQTKSK